MLSWLNAALLNTGSGQSGCTKSPTSQGSNGISTLEILFIRVYSFVGTFVLVKMLKYLNRLTNRMSKLICFICRYVCLGITYLFLKNGLISHMNTWRENKGAYLCWTFCKLLFYFWVNKTFSFKTQTPRAWQSGPSRRATQTFNITTEDSEGNSYSHSNKTTCTTVSLQHYICSCLTVLQCYVLNFLWLMTQHMQCITNILLTVFMFDWSITLYNLWTGHTDWGKTRCNRIQEEMLIYKSNSRYNIVIPYDIPL